VCGRIAHARSLSTTCPGPCGIGRRAGMRRDIPLWNETRWNGCWNPDDGVGLCHHAFMLAVMPEWTLHAIMIAPGDDRAPTHIGCSAGTVSGFRCDASRFPSSPTWRFPGQ
jgi:hypothetical protein